MFQMSQTMRMDDPTLAVPASIREQIAKYTDAHLARAVEFFTEWTDRGAPVPVTLFLAALKDEQTLRVEETASLIEPEIWS